MKTTTRNAWIVALGLCMVLVTPVLAGDKMSRTFDFPTGGTLMVDVDSGHVEIQTGGSGEVTVEVSVDRQNLSDYVELSFNETGDGLEIIGEEPRGRVHYGSQVAGPTAVELLCEALELRRRDGVQRSGRTPRFRPSSLALASEEPYPWSSLDDDHEPAGEAWR